MDVDRHVRAVHAEEGHPAQDEREDRRLEARAAGVAGRGHGSAGPQRAQHVRERRATNRVNRPGPSLRIERPPRGGHFVPGQDPRRTQLTKPLRDTVRFLQTQIKEQGLDLKVSDVPAKLQELRK